MTSLPRSRTPEGEAGLRAFVADPGRSVVCVDFDGTLAPIVERPEDARPAAGAVDALAALAGLVAGCAVVTGRAAAEAVRLGALDRVAGLTVLGHYGLQMWSGGRLDSPPPPTGIESARNRLRALVQAAPDGVHLEDKEHSLVVHTRPAADPARALAEVMPQVTAIAAALGLETVPGRYVVEVRPRGVDKGAGVRRMVEMHDARAVVYVGDDLGDLPAYDAVADLRRSGLAGVTVASTGADAPPVLAERADVVLAGPDDVVAFLRALAEAAAQR